MIERGLSIDRTTVAQSRARQQAVVRLQRPTAPLKTRRKLLIPRHRSPTSSSPLVGRRPMGTPLQSRLCVLLVRSLPGLCGQDGAANLLYLGEINDRQQASWCKTAAVFDEQKATVHRAEFVCRGQHPGEAERAGVNRPAAVRQRLAGRELYVLARSDGRRQRCRHATSTPGATVTKTAGHAAQPARYRCMKSTRLDREVRTAADKRELHRDDSGEFALIDGEVMKQSWGPTGRNYDNV